MLQQYHTKLKGTLALTDSYLTEKALQKEKGLYKFIWVRKGSITVEIDHQEMLMSQDDVISLTHLQHLEFKSIDGEYTTLLFNSNFYCIYGNDHEVSCSGFLFNVANPAAVQFAKDILAEIIDIFPYEQAGTPRGVAMGD